MDKPAEIFDRDHEWRSLDRFAANAKRGSTLGLVYGRRRQGKTFLLESLVQARGGFYFQALQQSDTQNLERLAQAFTDFTGSHAPVAFTTWDDAFSALLGLGENSDQPVAVVIDEFPYLLSNAPHLPSLLQAVLSPRSKAATEWRARLILCGSTISVMTSLLQESAPLRGRAALELAVHPFNYRETAQFWQVAHNPDVALRLHALVGGTPGYLAMSGGEVPQGPKDFDEWVVTALLEPASAMFREGHVLLAEGHQVTDATSYLAVLAAISQGRTRRGEIASAMGRKEGNLAHPLEVLGKARLITQVDDALRKKRATFHIAAPIMRFHQLVILPNEYRLERHHGPEVWNRMTETVSSLIYGPHFEELARSWCLDHADPTSLDLQAAAGTSARQLNRVGPTQVACREHQKNHQVDVVAVAADVRTEEEIVAIGEAKWRNEPCGQAHLRRLEHIKTLIGRASTAKLLLFSRSGFEPALTHEADARPDVELIDLDRLYSGS